MNKDGFLTFWENYFRGVEWQNSTQVSQWKSKVHALEVENACLRDFIQTQMCCEPGPVPSCSFLSARMTDEGGTEDQHIPPSKFDLDDSQSSEEDTISDTENNAGEDMVAFFEQTLRHQREHKKYVEEEKRKQEVEDSLRISDEMSIMDSLPLVERSDFMTMLYGDAAPKIYSMELSMQINFDMNRNKFNAKLWPNIPLRLS